MSTVYFVGAGPGDPELITLRGRRLLDGAGLVIYAGSLVNPALLEGIKAEVMDSASMDLDGIINAMSSAVREGRTVVRLHTGDISYFSAITEQIDRLKALGIPYAIVPGVSSVGAAAAAVGQELTIPEVSQSVIHTRMAGRTPVPERESIRSMAAHQATMVIFLSVGMMEKLVAELREGGYPEKTPVAVVERASWPTERVIRGTLMDIAAKVEAAGVARTALVLVGEALRASVDGGQQQSKLYDKEFKHGYRQ